VGSEGVTFTDYKPAKLPFGKPHPDPVVETASLGAVEPPDVTYELQLDDLVESGALSGLQLESIVYACQRHEQFLPDRSRCAFFIGDGELCVPANNTSPSTLFALRCMCVVWAYFDQFGMQCNCSCEGHEALFMDGHACGRSNVVLGNLERAGKCSILPSSIAIKSNKAVILS
jgi:hypothetical protein